MAGPPPTHLPPDPAQGELDAGQPVGDVVRRFPASPVAWAALAGAATMPAPRGHGLRLRPRRLPPLVWICCGATAGRGTARSRGSTSPTGGSSPASAILALSAQAIGEMDEYERCRDFLRDSSPTAYDVLFAGVE